MWTIEYEVILVDDWAPGKAASGRYSTVAADAYQTSSAEEQSLGKVVAQRAPLGEVSNADFYQGCQ